MHIKRRDSIKKWFITIIGDLLFFAPPVYLARLKINDYIEQDCDFKTITFNNNPKYLAQGIFKIATLTSKSR
jgi:beta-lactamase regulating signal transducer with metallopeptidase domain